MCVCVNSIHPFCIFHPQLYAPCIRSRIARFSYKIIIIIFTVHFVSFPLPLLAMHLAMDVCKMNGSMRPTTKVYVESLLNLTRPECNAKERHIDAHVAYNKQTQFMCTHACTTAHTNDPCRPWLSLPLCLSLTHQPTHAAHTHIHMHAKTNGRNGRERTTKNCSRRTKERKNENSHRW